jgi:hypothetical protein
MKTTALFLALALAAFGCNALSDHAADDAAADVIDSGGKADGADRPVGTYDLQGESNDAYLDMLVLKTDGTFVWSRGLTDTFGTYVFTRNNAGTTYIRCTSTDGEQLERLAYTLEGNLLHLRWASSNVSFTMEQGLGWCGEPADCDLQGLTHARCPGAWSCFSRVCDYQCAAPPENDCESFGGSCVADVPGACADGVIGDVPGYSCGGQVGVMCCIPHQPPSYTDCEAVGGTCVEFAPDACADGIPTSDSCGTSRSLSCCLPR